MAPFFKQNWKSLAVAVVAVLVVLLGLLIFRVFSFVDNLQATRVGAATPTVDNQLNVQSTATAISRQCAASINCVTGTASNGSGPARTVAPAVPTATPNLANSKIVQRIKAGERISVMYMGYGGPGHEGEYLTDSILVLSYDPVSQTVTQFNMPRDLWVSVPGYNGGQTFKSKANGIFSTIMKWEKPTQDVLDPKYRWTNPQEQHAAGANLVANTVQGVLGFKIDYWITMNFDAFRTLIDKMNGVTVCVERAFVDNDYPRNDNDQIDAGVMTIKFDKGCQQMNGERAIQFARSRKSNSEEGGDFRRSERQMKVVAAIKEEILKKDLFGNALSYMDALQGNVRISMPPDELASLAFFFNSAEGKEIARNLKFSPEIMTGNNFLKTIDKGGIYGYVLIPQAGEDRYGDIQAWVKTSFTYATLRREQASLQVLNASGTPGMADKLADYLETLGFRQAVPEAAIVQDDTVLVDYTNGAATANINQLKQLIPDLKVVSRTADKKPYDNAPALMLFLGKKYRGVATSGGQGGGPVATPKP